jgi:hypothetical protein
MFMEGYADWTWGRLGPRFTAPRQLTHDMQFMEAMKSSYALTLKRFNPLTL